MSTKSPFRRHRLLLVSSLALLIFLTISASLAAATRTWSGLGADTNWMTAGNWDVLPVAGDDLVFPAGVPGPSLTNINNFPALTNFNSITFSGNGYSMSGNSITLGAGGMSTTSNAAPFTNNLFFPVALGADGIFTTVYPGGLNIGAEISGAHTVIVAGAGTIFFSGANTYSGTTSVNGSPPTGSLTLANDLALGSADGTPATGTTVANGVHLGLFLPLTIGNESLTLNGGSLDVAQDASWAGPVTLQTTSTINPANTATLTLTGSVGGAGGLIKVGTGLLRLLANNTYTGLTTINQGTLSVENSQPSSAITVNSGGTLTGSNAGNMGPVTVSGGTIDPGVFPGSSAIITANGLLALNAASTFVVDLNASLSFDRIAVNGTVNLGGSTLTVSDNFGSAVGESFNIVVNDGTDAVVGTFAGLPEGTTFSVGGSFFSISYVAGTGNDVTLTRVAGGATATPTATTTPTATATATPTVPVAGATPTVTIAVPGPSIPTLSFPLLALLGITLALVGLHLARRSY